MREIQIWIINVCITLPDSLNCKTEIICTTLIQIKDCVSNKGAPCVLGLVCSEMVSADLNVVNYYLN